MENGDFGHGDWVEMPFERRSDDMLAKHFDCGFQIASMDVVHNARVLFVYLNQILVPRVFPTHADGDG